MPAPHSFRVLLATLLLVGLLAALPTPAGSATAQAAGTVPTERSAPAVQIRSHLQFTERNEVFLAGSLKPPEGPVVVQRATTCNRREATCAYRFWRKRKLDDGRFRVEIAAPPSLRGWVWRVRVGAAFGRAFITCTTQRPQDECKVPYGRTQHHQVRGTAELE